MICKHRRYLMYISQNYSYAILRPIQNYILAQGGEVCWFLEGDEVNPDYLSPEEIELSSIDDVISWNPDAVFVPGNVVPHFIPGVKVGVFHGFNSGKRDNSRGHFDIRGFFDLYCTQGPNTTEEFQRLATKHGFFNVVETGWSNLDPMYRAIENNPYLSSEDARPTILFCSTFTPKLSCADTVFETVKRLSEKGNWRWLVQFHPKMENTIVEKYKSIQGSNLQFVETDNVIPLLRAADVMLCDTSSVLIMFLLLNRPVVTFRNRSPSDYLINVTKVNEIEEALSLAISKPDKTMSAIREYAEQVHPYRDGISSVRVVEATNKLIEQGTGNLKRKPLNLFRKFKIRKKLGYWKL
ncbi:CDP-glycerol glycerophosphotransferase family protein [Vibrio comitans]|uniref:CDP-glycerol--glycerophosphate glycerophosphotransferase n=2 Tax=Vibrio comitans TaxID=413401 RepID=A0A4Y3IQ59_9VIBR|nr:CDP-glycerol glycerophosphotransferase family protein [Vibrio comitans]GEA61387.1 CDP-glycerol--glycerophosphate glycerophosphotransferase [Vibrio comitans NBRC 102076]